MRAPLGTLLALLVAGLAQAQTATVGTAGGSKGLQAAYVGTSSGNKAVVNGYVGTATGNRIFFAALSASVSPGAANGARLGAGIVTTNNVTCSPTGGIGPYTYAWTYTPSTGVNPNINSPSSATTSFTRYFVTPPDGLSGTATCTITDTGAGATAQASASVSLSAS